RQMVRISQGCLLIILSIANVVCILCLLKYGRLLIVLTEESVRLVGDEKDDSLFNRPTYKAYLKKVRHGNIFLKEFFLKVLFLIDSCVLQLKIINFALTVIVGWSSVTFL